MQPPTTTHNQSQPPTTIHNHLQLPKKTPATIHNHLQPTKNYAKKPKLVTNSYVTELYMLILKQTLALIVVYIHECVCVCVHILYKSLYLLFFG